MTAADTAAGGTATFAGSAGVSSTAVGTLLDSVARAPGGRMGSFVVSFISLLKLDANGFLQRAERAFFFGRHQRHGGAVGAVASGAADAVHVGLRRVGHLEVHHLR